MDSLQREERHWLLGRDPAILMEVGKCYIETSKAKYFTDRLDLLNLQPCRHGCTASV